MENLKEKNTNEVYSFEKEKKRSREKRCKVNKYDNGLCYRE